MKNYNGFVAGVVVFFTTTMFGILIAMYNLPIYYTHSEIIYYPNEDKTYLEEYKVKQSIWSYVSNNGVIKDNELIEVNKYEIVLKED